MTKEERSKQWHVQKLPVLISNLTPRQQKDLNMLPFKVLEDVKSTYIFGTTGSGKTIKALQMMLSAMHNYYIEYKTMSAEFTSVIELLQSIKAAYDRTVRNSALTEEEIITLYKNIPILVLDDFEVAKTTDWAYQILYLIINHRYEYDKLTIITSNASLEELAEKMNDDRIPGRIQQMCRIVKTKDINFRERS